jgi:excisionase family DNA binding protein
LATADDTIVIYTVAEAAVILRVKESWLERQAAARKIPFTMLGGAYHFTSMHLAEIVRMHEKIPVVQPDEPERPTTRRVPRDRRRMSDLAVTPLRPRPRPIGPRRVA